MCVREVSQKCSDPAVLESVNLALAVLEDVVEHSHVVFLGLNVSLDLLVELGVLGLGVRVNGSPGGEELEVGSGDVLSAHSASSIGAHLVNLVDNFLLKSHTLLNFLISGILLEIGRSEAFFFAIVRGHASEPSEPVSLHGCLGLVVFAVADEVKNGLGLVQN